MELIKQLSPKLKTAGFWLVSAVGAIIAFYIAWLAFIGAVALLGGAGK